ncbi:chorismate mutase 3, chloroplastic [Malania oleifera]|uniref:chorismate mutase 3, chloroplastic n=1 Tax=Malania oleifera TaxID=397392 RepID=UPI0025AE98F4|nr:chorismate mutase 3, chloroplastic [Malania oleifera]
MPHPLINREISSHLTFYSPPHAGFRGRRGKNIHSTIAVLCKIPTGPSPFLRFSLCWVSNTTIMLLFQPSTMDAKLSRASIPATSAPGALKSSMLDLQCANQINCKPTYEKSGFVRNGYRPLQASLISPIRFTRKKKVDESDTLTLESIRHSLIRQDDSIIFSLMERAQYCYNEETYDHNAFSMDRFRGSLVEFIVKETETLSAKLGRYKSPDEHPFFLLDLPEPMLPTLQFPQVLHPCADRINLNNKVWNVYFRDLLPRLVKAGNDNNCGSAAVCDTICLQALSKRIHYGKFVAEAKFRESPAIYDAAIKVQDRAQLMALLTYETVEEAVKKRVEMKAKTYGQEVSRDQEDDNDATGPVYKIKPSLVANLYEEWITPLTKEVQVEYLLRRLD